MQRLASPNNTSSVAINRRAVKHNFRSTKQQSAATANAAAANQLSAEKKRRQASIDLVPKLDLKKAEKYTNLADPYAYLRDSYQSSSNQREPEQNQAPATEKPEAVITCSTLRSIDNSENESSRDSKAKKEVPSIGSRTQQTTSLKTNKSTKIRPSPTSASSFKKKDNSNNSSAMRLLTTQ